MHCEIIDRYLNVFLEIQMKQKNLKSVFWASEFGRPNQYTGLPNGLNTSLEYNTLPREIRSEKNHKNFKAKIKKCYNQQN